MATIKQRNVALSIVLTIITCGLYGIYWEVCMVDDVNRLTGKEDAKSGIIVFLLSLITCNIYWMYWLFKTGETIDLEKSKKGLPSSNRGLVYLILTFFALGIVADAILQSDINGLAEGSSVIEEKHDDSEM